MPAITPATILLAEDNDVHALLFTVAFRIHKDVNMVRVHDGVEAKQYLMGMGEYADREQYPRPLALVTDLIMPRCDGASLISWLRRHEHWAQLPAVVISTSIFQEDMDRCYQAGAQAFLLKPCTAAGFSHLVDCLSRLWSERGVLPAGSCDTARPFSLGSGRGGTFLASSRGTAVREIPRREEL